MNNEEIKKLYGIPYKNLNKEEKAILKADSKRRATLINDREQDVIKNNIMAFSNEAEAEKVLVKIYGNVLDQILANVMKTIAKVQKAGGEWSYANQSALTRSAGLFEQIGYVIKDLTGQEKKMFYDHLSNLYTDQFLREVYSLGQSIVVNADFNKLNPALVKKTIEYPWSGAMFSDRLWLDKQTLGKNLRAGLTQSMILGESIQEVSARLSKSVNTSLYNAERIVRTETKRINYIAHVEAFKDSGIKKVKYRVANGGDSRVCPVCRADNDKIYELGTEPTLPRHPNCRCVYIPVVEDTFKPNELNELTGSIRGAENYEKWINANKDKLNTDGTFKDGWSRNWKTFELEYKDPKIKVN